MRQQWILRVDILEILEVHQIHIGEVKRVVKRRLHRRQQQALWSKGNVNVVIWSELAVTNCSLTINASAIKTYLRIAIYLIWLSGGTAPWSSTSAHCLTRNSTENLNKFGQLHAAKWTLHARWHPRFAICFPLLYSVVIKARVTQSRDQMWHTHTMPRPLGLINWYACHIMSHRIVSCCGVPLCNASFHEDTNLSSGNWPTEQKCPPPPLFHDQFLIRSRFKLMSLVSSEFHLSLGFLWYCFVARYRNRRKLNYIVKSIYIYKSFYLFLKIKLYSSKFSPNWYGLQTIYITDICTIQSFINELAINWKNVWMSVWGLVILVFMKSHSYHVHI